jgi:hypothetical protein
MLNNGKLYLEAITGFWISMYQEDAMRLEASARGQAEKLAGVYFQYLQRQLPPNIQDYPIFKEAFWHIIELHQKDQEFFDNRFLPTTEENASYIRWKLDDSYAKIPYLYDLIFNPSCVLSGGEKDELSVNIESGELVLYREYVNDFDAAITHDGKVIPKGEKFFATQNTYSIAPNSSGKVTVGRDYFIERKIVDSVHGSKIVNSYIYFRVSRNPFNIKNSPVITEANGQKKVTFFAPKVFIDNLELFNIFGSVLNVVAESSWEYRNFLNGILYLYTNGPSITALNTALNVSYGFPVAKADEIILKVNVTPEYYILKSSLNNKYYIKRYKISYMNTNLNPIEYYGPKLSLSNKKVFNRLTQSFYTNSDFSNNSLTPPGTEYDVYWEVKRFDSFLEFLKVVDYNTDPKWWLDPDIQKSIYYNLSPDLPEEDRQNPEIIDYLFENYLKYHTFGLKINFAELVNKQPFRDFFRILNETKPTYKTFVIPDPSPVIHDNSEIHFDTQEISIASFISINTLHLQDLLLGTDFYGMVGMNPNSLDNPRIGVALESFDPFYDMTIAQIDFYSDLDENDNPTPGSIYSYFSLTPDYNITMGALSEGDNIYLGLTNTEGLLEYVEINSFLFVRTPPKNLSANDITEYSAILSWEIDLLTGADYLVDYFVVEYSFDANYTSIINTFTTSSNSLLLTNLPDATMIYWRVKAVFNDSEETTYTNSNFLTSDYLILWNMQEGSGYLLQDSSTTPYATGLLESFIDDSIIEYNMNEGSGVILNDSSPNDNDASVETYTEANTTIIEYNMNEGSGVILNDSSPNDNDAILEDI